MQRCKLKNKANRTKLLDDIAKYKKQRYLVAKLNRNSKLNECRDIKKFKTFLE